MDTLAGIEEVNRKRSLSRDSCLGTEVLQGTMTNGSLYLSVPTRPERANKPEFVSGICVPESHDPHHPPPDWHARGAWAGDEKKTMIIKKKKLWISDALWSVCGNCVDKCSCITLCWKVTSALLV